MINRLSFKIGVLFSSITLIFLLLLGYISYGLYSQTFIDYIAHDLLVRGENHAKVLTDNFNETTIHHVGLMEQNVVTEVVVTDNQKNILANSDLIDEEMLYYIKMNNTVSQSEVLNKNWQEYQHITTISPINHGELGYVYMFYPSDVLRETVFVIKGLVFVTSLGIVLIAIVLIILLSRKMAQPLLKMKEVTNKMAMGNYKQKLDIKGKDELGQLANSIRILGDQLDEYEETRNDFLASVSHELRTPLTYIKGYTDILEKGLIEDETEKKQYLNIISKETKRVTHLVNDLFELSKIQTGQIRLNIEKIRLEEIIEKVIHNLRPVANKKGLSIHFKKPEIGLPLIDVDPVRMEQVFFNLIENALTYTDHGSIRVEIKQEERKVNIKIKDTGIGIPERDIPKIWNRFYRVEKSRARKTGGSGIGLYLVKEIIQLHKGSIRLTSTEGKGTEVSIDLTL